MLTFLELAQVANPALGEVFDAGVALAEAVEGSGPGGVWDAADADEVVGP
jgi:hypothetical protein